MKKAKRLLFPFNVPASSPLSRSSLPCIDHAHVVLKSRERQKNAGKHEC